MYSGVNLCASLFCLPCRDQSRSSDGRSLLCFLIWAPRRPWLSDSLRAPISLARWDLVLLMELPSCRRAPSSHTGLSRPRDQLHWFRCGPRLQRGCP
ncbi:hypothetical protein NDU88_007067 [Pleurodeles waltl]|uniref:Uncharacterized protein n=1 Tax=Pleurodeles waltl TaxID=8319 RepID=A0AAV7VRF9_PLEWA|nr:hypothetical protein NDU88_007067 [Pleurodeles waltl]